MLYYSFVDVRSYSKMDRSLFFSKERTTKKSNHSLDAIRYISFASLLSEEKNDDKVKIFRKMYGHHLYLHLSNWSLYILLMICETIGSRPRQSICKYRLQDPCAKLHSFSLSHIMMKVPFTFLFYMNCQSTNSNNCIHDIYVWSIC
jgi:hypothetical protein